MTTGADLAARHDELRPLMFSVAYRMLGSVTDAEDVVQEAFLRLHQRAGAGPAVDNAEAFATTVVTRLAIDTLRSARRRRERYVGTWLPEPLPDDAQAVVAGHSAADPAERVVREESVSLAFLVVLERLSPLERAVFLLREVFGHEYAEIAVTVDRTETNCRQVYSRAKRRIADAETRFAPEPERAEQLAAQFLAAAEGQDLAGLERLLAEDVVFYADGGGKAPAIKAPLHGSLTVARFVVGLVRQMARRQARLEPTAVGGHPAYRLLTADGQLLGLLALHIDDGRVTSLRNQINPDKLRHLGDVADMRALLEAERRGG